MNRDLAWIALNMAHGLDRVRVHATVEQKLDVAEIVADPHRFHEIAPGEERSLAQLLAEAAGEIDLAGRLGAILLTLASPGYPEALREIYDPPLALYCLGRVPSEGSLAIVGSRSATPYGVAIARSWAREIAARHIAVVSGFARGIDTAAHLGALDAGGVTVAVMGSGFHHPYPRENQPLIAKVAEKGCVLTEFPLDTAPFPRNFPLRNRVISGLGTKGTLVVEAAERSGALITARLASDQGRDVFAVPGNVTSPQSAGTNRLIQDGAKLVRSPADILGELADQGAASPPVPMEPAECAVLERLTVDGPVHIDALSTELGVVPAQLLVTLLSLELKSRVRQLPGKFFVKRL